ncbi:MAG: hypothetical protein PHR06_10130 [Candidatus Cloacimonetes bacterium]|nr:hypothetical protein [Candidatus Cloacimonadota bacterium]
MAITINSNVLQNISTAKSFDAYKSQSIERDTKKLAKISEKKDYTIRNASPAELKDYLSDTELKVISELFEAKDDGHLPNFHSKSRYLTLGNRIDIKL